jgi:hypothetical protein
MHRKRLLSLRRRPSCHCDNRQQPVDYYALLISRYCAQGHAGARAVRRLRITFKGTPGLSLATASAFASMIVLISARIRWMRSSSIGGRVNFISFEIMDLGSFVC